MENKCFLCEKEAIYHLGRVIVEFRDKELSTSPKKNIVTCMSHKGDKSLEQDIIDSLLASFGIPPGAAHLSVEVYWEMI